MQQINIHEQRQKKTEIKKESRKERNRGRKTKREMHARVNTETSKEIMHLV